MYPDPKAIESVQSGHLYIMAKPSGGENLDDDSRHLQRLGIGSVVSMLEVSEAAELGLANEGGALAAVDISFLNTPVPDRSVPSNTAAYFESLAGSYARLSEGANLVVHCRAGIGRSGMYCAALMIANGHCVTSALDVISAARGIGVPDTQIQIDWLNDHSAELSSILGG